jgi:hypothetical protein
VSDCGGLLSKCPEVSKSENLSISDCKIKDLSSTQNSSMSMGFPRPNFIQSQKATPRILLIPLSFKDLKFTDPKKELKDELDFAAEIYKKTSWNQIKIEYSYIPENKYLDIGENFEDYKNSLGSDLGVITSNLIQKLDYSDITKFDGVYLITKRSDTISWGGGSGSGAPISTKFGDVRNYYLYVGGPLMNGDSISKSLAHTLGHTLYGLPDLYISSWAINEKVVIPKNQIFYDLMANGISDDFLAWQRWLNGWLSDQDVICLNPAKNSTVYLNFLENNAGKRLVVIPNKIGSVIALEYRNASTFGYANLEKYSGSGKGLLVYQFDSNVRQGFGQVTAGDNGSSLLVNNESIIFNGFEFQVLAVDDYGMYIKITKN